MSSIPAWLAVAVLAAGEAPAGEVPFLAAPGGFTVEHAESSPEIAVSDGQGREVARYMLRDCPVRSGAAEEGTPDGVFGPIFADAAEPVVVAVCHGSNGGRRLALFAPARDRVAPTFVVAAVRSVAYVLRPDRIEVAADGAMPVVWLPGRAADPEALAMVAEAADMANRHALALPARPDDADLVALAGRLEAIAAARDAEALLALAGPEILTNFGGSDTPEEFRTLIAEPWFWEEFARVLAGGAALSPDWEDGRRAFFPAAFEAWPQDLDAYGYLYGDRPDAVLRAGPSVTAPAVAGLHLRILAELPYAEALKPLYLAGWRQGCVEPEGCGFARAEQVRSPIDWRAVFVQKVPGAPWVLETFVAGD